MDSIHLSRREFLSAGGALVVSVVAPGGADTARGQTTGVIGDKPPLMPDELDSWIAILPDGKVNAFFGKMDMGQGVDVAVGQIVADELDVRFERVTVVMGENDESVPFAGVQQTWRRWKKSGRLAEGSRFVAIPGGDHGLVDHVGAIASEVRRLAAWTGDPVRKA